MKKVFTALCMFFSLHAFSQATYYVNDDASGANNGSSWVNAFTKLQDALSKAVSGDQVWVAEGTYYPDEGVGFANNNRSHSFLLKNGVGIYGGFAGTETNLSQRNWQTHVTILNGDIEQDDQPRLNNAYHVVTGSNVGKTAVLDGFTITKGHAEESSGGGGGIYTLTSSPTIRNCTISDNFSDWEGGGIYNINSSPQYINCTISGNSTGIGGSTGETIGTGGGVYNNNSTSQFINCTISGNSASGFKYYLGTGGGVYNNNSSTQFTNCTISGNQAEQGGGVYNNGSNSSFNYCNISGNVVYNDFGFGGDGGGVYNSNSPSQFTNCTISGNGADRTGGGVYNYNSLSNFTNCIISENYVGDGIGGGISNIGASSNFVNCIISGNVANDSPGGAGENSGCSPHFINCSFLGNSGVGANIFLNYNASPIITNCIIWGNGHPLDPLFWDEGGSHTTVTYSIVQGGFPGTGNLDQDPLFVDAVNGDLHLQEGSPAIDKGLNSANATTVDLDGKPRVVNGIIDMGAYEFQVTPLVITSVTANPSTLWPPNHKMKEVKVTTVTTGGSGNTQCSITKVSSNEAQSEKGKKGLAPDWQVIGADKVLLRAERNGNGEGRIYTITVTCTDASGSSASKTVQVKVPHDQGKAEITQSERSEIIGDISGALHITASPNPSSNAFNLTISGGVNESISLRVMNALGKVIEQRQNIKAGQTLQIGQGYAAGMYIIEIQQGSERQTIKVVKQ